MKTARKITLQALRKMEQQQSYSNLTIEPMLKKSGLDGRDRSFAFNLFYGVLENKILLDYTIQRYSNRPIRKLSVDVLNILRMGLYQLIYLDLKDFAAVNESVALAKEVRQSAASGFINAVLRQFLRDGKQIVYPDRDSDFENYLMVRYSCPVWLVRRLVQVYGKQKTEEFLSSQMGKPPLTVRVNTTLTTPDGLIEQFKEQGIQAEGHPYIQGCIKVISGTDIITTSMFEQGLFHVQDVASQICAILASAYQPKDILDTCAAPGGKTFTMAQELGDARITACDLHQHRVNLISSGAERLKLNNINAIVQDAASYNPELGEFDLVLCDVPCSGFGVIRRKPEIKYKTEESVKGLPEIQYKILSSAGGYLKQDGILIYSTCTILPEENQQVVDRFLSSNPGFELCRLPGLIRNYYPEAESQAVMLPGKLDNDGFYICAMRRKGESV